MNPETLGNFTQDPGLLRSESLRTSNLELETSHESQRGSDEQETPPFGPKRVGTQLLTVPDATTSSDTERLEWRGRNDKNLE